MRYLNRTVLFFVCALGVLVVLVGYDLRAFRNLSASEAMDSAQLARNLAQGKGYTTLFVRPLSVYLLAAHSRQTNANAGDPAQLRTSHPDLANPPVYPVVLAGLMKALPFKFAVPTRPTPFWSPDGRFYRYQPDFLIALFNQALLCGLVVCVFFLARRLFDTRVATLSAVVLFTTEVLWRFSVSGLSTLLLLLIFMALTTLSFLITTPEAWVLALGDSNHGFPYLSGVGRLIIKDSIMLGAAFLTMTDAAGESLRRRSRRA